MSEVEMMTMMFEGQSVLMFQGEFKVVLNKNCFELYAQIFLDSDWDKVSEFPFEFPEEKVSAARKCALCMLNEEFL